MHVPGRVGDDEQTQPLMLVWSDATESAQAGAHHRADHVREVLTGYRSGSREVAREGEPRLEYHPQRPLRERQKAKAKELDIGLRTLERWVSRYRDTGEAGLIDTRMSRTGAALTNYDPRWVDAALAILDEQDDQSKVQKKIILARIRARVERLHGPDVVTFPSTASAYRALDELTRGRGTFADSTKAKRSIANRPVAPYGRLTASRPGEFVLLDVRRGRGPGPCLARDPARPSGRWENDLTRCAGPIATQWVAHPRHLTVLLKARPPWWDGGR